LRRTRRQALSIITKSPRSHRPGFSFFSKKRKAAEQIRGQEQSYRAIYFFLPFFAFLPFTFLSTFLGAFFLSAFLVSFLSFLTAFKAF